MAEGYDTTRFHSTIDESFVCCICLGVLQDPKQCENNEHYFCSGCIKKHLEKTSHSCPVCQDKLTVETLRKAPRIVADCVSRYKISCDHAARGCDAVLELGALQAHVQDCDFMPVTCSNESCDEVVSKRDVKQHELDLCRFKTTTCDDCGKKMSHHKYGAHSCVLRRDVDEMKNDLAEVKATQNEMMKGMRDGMQRLTIAVESLQKSVNSKSTDIVVIAGRNPKTKQILSSVERFNLFNQTWTQLPGLKIARWLSAAVIFKNQIIACGGFDESDGHLDSIEVLDLNGNRPEWHEFFVNLPIKVVGHKCVVHGNRLLIIGGQTKPGENLDTIYELLLVPPYSSKLLCHMKKKRIFHGVELFDDKVLIAGGEETETDVEIFDIARNECVEMPLLPSPVFRMGTVRRGDAMLLIGGLASIDAGKYRNEIIEYDFKTGQSKVLLAMKTGRAYCSCISRGNTLIVIGGANGEFDAMDCFDFLSNSWKRLPSMAEARRFAPAVVVNMENLEF
ncbi:E3 ubiquitin- ligase NRDP1 isoform X1 [Paramuricea clavata]|uniref:E3 ubiquitin- ligase NRDP1 isoform X1 n=1 Tax=Paramuricea clavata TaxID=317549 RepID=A0A7D9J036_PARCT|nr:E3 ubiquitin- ligase NRDP1 isoform X1 [Paramuricea clavata]